MVDGSSNDRKRVGSCDVAAIEICQPNLVPKFNSSTTVEHLPSSHYITITMLAGCGFSSEVLYGYHCRFVPKVFSIILFLLKFNDTCLDFSGSLVIGDNYYSWGG